MQALISQIYAQGQFHDKLKYHAQSKPPLRSEEEAWADNLRREKGLRRDASL